jgi:putative PIN family toxin of toxin-antitoxin system
VKAVFDTNVLIAAFVAEGICSRLFVRARRRQFTLITCPFILGELERILTKKFLVARGQVREVLRLIAQAVEVKVHPTQVITGVCRDPEDDNVLACALAAQADYLVTGDADLLAVHEFKGTSIVTPKDFELLFND